MGFGLRSVSLFVARRKVRLPGGGRKFNFIKINFCSICVGYGDEVECVDEDESTMPNVGYIAFLE